MVNGRPLVLAVDPAKPLLRVLREDLRLTGVKQSFDMEGECGACIVIVDGVAQRACLVLAGEVEGRAVETVEGLAASGRPHPLQIAFLEAGAVQCGYCTPGMLMSAKALLDRNPRPTRGEIVAALAGNLCRCTGYVKILDAIESVARGETPVLAPAGGIGASTPKYEAAALALGERRYIDDMRPEGLLHAALHLTAHARAEVRGIDTTAAAAAPDVVAVFTVADVPGELRVGIIHKDWPILIPVGGRTSYAGDVLAVVVARTQRAARAAAALVRVDYEPLRPITDPETAAADPELAVWGTDSNVLSRSQYRRGDVDAALAASAHRVTETFRTQRIEHAFLEPESSLAAPERRDGARHLQVWSGGQGVWDDRNDIARVLGLPNDAVTVTLVSNGGAFGGKEDMANQAHAALAAWLLDAPVKCTLSREESFLIHAKRHPIRMTYEAGCDAQGRLTALRVRAVGDSGAYASVGMKVLERMAGHASGPYHLPTIDVESVAVRTNNPICGAFRGFGANQAQFAMEGVMDRLAAAVGIDAWEMRSRNAIAPGAVWGPGQVMDDGALGARACLDAIRPHFDAARAAGKAVGLGLGLKNSGLGNGFKEVTRAVVRFRDDGRIEVRHGWTEMGQGIHTVALQVAVSELGVDPARVDVIVDTTRELGLGQTTGSRGTLMGAGAVKAACDAARAAGCAPEVDHLGEYRVDWTHKLGAPGIEHPIIHSTFGYAAQLVVADRATGAIERVVAAHDVGRAINPQLCAGQIEGSVHMGLGYALTEDFPADPATGFPTLDTLRGLGILRAKDVPAIEVILVESPQPNAPYGIKGVGEIGLVPTAGAVAAALHEVDGRWRTTLQMRRRDDEAD